MGSNKMVRIDKSGDEAGFTMVEIFITLAIAAILLALAVPSFTGLVGDNKIVSATNEFVASVHMTRSEAIKRGQRTGMCPSADPQAAAPVCSATASWTSGWIIFVDDDEDGVRDAPGEELILSAEPLSAGFTFTPQPVASPKFKERIYFDTEGTTITSAGNPVSGQIVIQYGDAETRMINISATGRIKTEEPVS
ncbi:MAG: GspH/FimT family pseudopilin [Granulosicoccus sp.]|nr:GspH/FimT family pseudopilin [Granulosicoccus sp.]